MAQAIGTSPFTKIIVKVLQLFSLIAPITKVRYVVLLVVVMNIFQFLGLVEIWDDFETKISPMMINSFLTVLAFNDIVSKIVLLKLGYQFKKFVLKRFVQRIP